MNKYSQNGKFNRMSGRIYAFSPSEKDAVTTREDAIRGIEKESERESENG